MLFALLTLQNEIMILAVSSYNLCFSKKITLVLHWKMTCQSMQTTQYLPEGTEFELLQKLPNRGELGERENQGYK